MDIEDSAIGYLRFDGSEGYGLTWKVGLGTLDLASPKESHCVLPLAIWNRGHMKAQWMVCRYGNNIIRVSLQCIDAPENMALVGHADSSIPWRCRRMYTIPGETHFYKKEPSPRAYVQYRPSSSIHSNRRP